MRSSASYACPALGAAIVLAAALLAPPAAAYENQWHAGAELGYMGGWNGIGHGVGGGLDVSYGVTDWLDVVASLDVSGHPATKLVVPSGTVGVRFVFDRFQVVPYVGAQIGGAGVVATGACPVGCSLGKLDVALPFGADYQVSRSFTIGVAGRFQLLLLKGSATPMLGAFAKVQYAWGY